MEALEAASVDMDEHNEADSCDDEDYSDDDYAESNTDEILSPLDESDIVKCNECSENIIRTFLKEHRKVQHSACKSVVCKCVVCGDMYDKPSLLDHLRSKHMDTWDSLECQFCSKVVTRKSNLLQHIVFRHSSFYDVLPSKQDNEVTIEPKAPGDHETPDNGTLRQECTVCHKLVVNLQSHMVLHNRLYNCDSCSLSFNTEERLNVHKETHKRHVLSCRFCNSKFTNSVSLYKHIKTLHTTARYKCPVCGNKFNRRDNMVRHANRMHGYSADKRKHVK